ncbi:uncharacterized protein LOC141644397 [Silene latifolia]|uniref:uncharacterized protein LOC141644397 n=1 Tax=Silene latifolia TaxID=37657 RepID=UPI003D774470
MAGEETTADTTFNPSFPVSRVKKIVKFDKDISRVTSEALFLVSGAAELFLHFLAEKSSDIVTAKKRKTIKLEDLRIAVKRHQPAREFLLDSLPMPTVSQPVDRPRADRMVKEKPVPAHTRRIDSFFKKPVSEKGSIGGNGVDDVIQERVEDVDDVILERAENNEIPEGAEDVDDLIPERVEDVDDVIPECVEDDLIVERVDDVILERVEDVDDVILEHVEDVDDVIPEHVGEVDEVIPDADDVILVDEA